MKALYLTLLAIGMSLAAAAQDAVLGRWWSPKRDAQIEIFKATNGKYYGRLIWAKVPDKKDEHNPNPTLRQRELVGLNLFTNFNYDSDDDEWVDGKIYDPKTGKTYSCKMWVTNGGNTLNARGYIGLSLLGRTEKFDRVQ